MIGVIAVPPYSHIEGLAENSRFAASPSDFNFQLGSLVDVLT
jgi:hypothetical protein